MGTINIVIGRVRARASIGMVPLLEETSSETFSTSTTSTTSSITVPGTVTCTDTGEWACRVVAIGTAQHVAVGPLASVVANTQDWYVPENCETFIPMKPGWAVAVRDA